MKIPNAKDTKKKILTFSCDDRGLPWSCKESCAWSVKLNPTTIPLSFKTWILILNRLIEGYPEYSMNSKKNGMEAMEEHIMEATT